MNWDAVAAVSEAMGAVAVVVTLAYLAVQIRQNTAALRSSATQGAHDQAAEFYQTLCEDQDLGLIDLAHTTRADGLGNLIRPKLRSGS